MQDSQKIHRVGRGYKIWMARDDGDLSSNIVFANASFCSGRPLSDFLNYYASAMRRTRSNESKACEVSKSLDFADCEVAQTEPFLEDAMPTGGGTTIPFHHNFANALAKAPTRTIGGNSLTFLSRISCIVHQ